jgi:hypothetical protein
VEAETPLLARISDFGLALLPYWWLLVTGGVLLVEPMIETLVPQAWKNTVDQRWSKETRHKNFRWASVGALLIASFLAFDDISTRNRVLQRDLVQATRERDEAKRERDEIIKQLPVIGSATQRDPDAIYQAGVVVGKAFGARRSPTDATSFEFVEVTHVTQF